MSAARPAPITHLPGARQVLLLAVALLLALAPALGAVPAPTATAASATGLTWGVKESFRSYVTGSIAEGTITTAGGASQRADGTFFFPRSSGTVTDGTVTASFSGSVTFTGHDHGQGPLLELTVSKISVRLSGGGGTLRATVRSRSLESTDASAEPGELVTYPGITLATLSGAGASTSGARATWSALAATLTSAGAPAFGGFYQAGQALDPVTAVLPTTSAAGTTGDGSGDGSGGSSSTSSTGGSGGASDDGTAGSGSGSGSTDASGTGAATGTAAPTGGGTVVAEAPAWAGSAPTTDAAVPVVASTTTAASGAGRLWAGLALVGVPVALGMGVSRATRRRGNTGA